MRKELAFRIISFLREKGYREGRSLMNNPLLLKRYCLGSTFFLEIRCIFRPDEEEHSEHWHSCLTLKHRDEGLPGSIAPMLEFVRDGNGIGMFEPTSPEQYAELLEKKLEKVLKARNEYLEYLIARDGGQR